jgi:hypothetical protein
MGFDDELASIRALEMHHGNVNRAIDYLLMNPAPVPAPASSAPAPASGASAPASNGGGASDAPVEESASGSNDEAPAEPKGTDDKKND